MNAKILIADDESDIVSMLGSFFESKGFRVLPASNGAEALKQVEKQPDIILLDINMPGTDGLEVCKRIRDHISCPILFLTARIEDTDKVNGFGVMTARATAALWQSISAGYEQRLRHIQTGYILKQFGGADING